jgi:hypothetical protein
MKSMLFLILISIVLVFLGVYCESQKDPYEIGTHWDYTIVCENGFIYKYNRYGTIQVLNTDGTPLKCGEKVY